MRQPQSSGTSSGPAAGWGWLGLVLACALGLAVRARGIDFVLPHYTPSDELVMVDQVENLRLGRPQVALDGTVAPSYPLLCAFIAQHAVLHRPGSGPAELPEHLARASALRLDLRWATALLSLLIVPGTWFLARRFLSPGWATFAALLVAVSVLNVSNSQMGRPHGPVSALMVLGVLGCMRLARGGRALDYLLAGLGIALALGCLHSGAALLAPLLVGHALSRRQRGRASAWWLLGVLVLLAAVVRVTYPFHFDEWTQAEALQESGEVNISGHRLWWGDFNGEGFLRVLGTLYSYDPMTLLLFVGGALAALARLGRLRAWSSVKRGDLLVAASFAVPYLVLIGLYMRTAERFVMPLQPYVACLAAYGAARLSDGLRLEARGRAALAVVLLVVPALGVWGLTSARSGPDAFEEAAAYMMEHLDPDTSRTYLMPYHTLPLLYGADSLAFNWEQSRRTEWLEYLHEQPAADLLGPRWEVIHPKRRNASREIGDDPLGWLRREGFTHVLIQHVRPGFRERALPEMRAALVDHAQLLARFTPLREDDGDPARVDYNYSRRVLERPFVLHLLLAKGMGSTLELYRLAP